MLAVSDTTALTTLLKAGKAELLEQVFGPVIVPEAVAAELLHYQHPSRRCST